MVRRLESDDLVHWGSEQIVLRADSVDLAKYQCPDWTERPPVDYYGACVFRYPDADGLYIMMANAFWHWYDRRPDKNVEPQAEQADQLKWLGPTSLDTRLFVSRNGKEFEPVGGRKPFFRPGPEGSFYSRRVWANPKPIRMGDELWIYFSGKNTDHSHFRDPTATRDLSGISRAILRLDGFVSADADYSGGEIITPLIEFEGKTLELNLDTGGGGQVLVELLNHEGQPIEGYTRADAIPLCGNSVRMPVSWGENSDLSMLANKPIKIRFLMKDCKLYAFQFIS